MTAQILVIICSGYASIMLCIHGYLQSRDRRHYSVWFYQMKALAAFSCITICGSNTVTLIQETPISPDREVTKFCVASLCFAIGTSRIYLVHQFRKARKRGNICTI